VTARTFTCQGEVCGCRDHRRCRTGGGYSDRVIIDAYGNRVIVFVVGASVYEWPDDDEAAS
jgi:hypothetical protein